uniref:SOWAHA-C winged helix-turn-helix domain-containing protein n=1 Tax=Periophthalmus magnuspinnatus TaxID=409849 RepID=A0A3B4B7P5_9GOBI
MGGKVKKSELVRRFKGLIECDDHEQRECNREMFKNFVNNVAVVKEIDGARFVVLRKKYEPLLESYQAQEGAGNTGDDVHAVRKGELQRPPVPSEDARNGDELQEQNNDESCENPSEMVNPIQMALQRCKYDFTPRRSMGFGIQNAEEKQASRAANMDSPNVKKSKSSKVSTEMKENRVPSTVPLEQNEHEWLVKCASGHWSQVYGLLLLDSQLAEKKDFISGFTALHWAAKFGNSDMLVKIFEVSKQGGVEVDVNAKTHGGYTPLHIAALHDQEYILAMLVAEYGADPKIRDNCGRRAYHYLHKGVSQTIREMLGQPKFTSTEINKVNQYDKEEQEVFPDLSKGLQSISKLFQPTLTGHKKKSKSRTTLYSLQDEPEMEERQDGSVAGRYRVVSDVFM